MADTDDFGYDDVALDAEFAAFRTGLLDRVTPPGPDAVRSTVRRRRRVATTGALALALVVIVGPVAGYAALNRTSPSPTGPIATDGPTPSPTPSTSPTPSAGPSVSASATPGAPDGRISRADLLRATVDLPAWRSGPGCPANGARLTDRAVDDGDNVLVATAYGDVDADGATETVALVTCLVGQGGPMQVVAFDRDDAGGIVTVGQVVRSDPKAQWFTDIEVRANGVVRVEVADEAPGGGWPLEYSQRQWRGYRWDGQVFGQSEGPRSFPDNPYGVNLTVTATDLVYRAPEGGGLRTGEVTLTLRNVGTVTAQRPRLEFDVRPGGAGTAASPGWYDCEDSRTDGERSFCTLKPLRAGEERKVTFHLVNAGPGLPTTATVALLNLNGGGGVAADFEPGDNRATMKIK
ncbi:hypothetical protein OG792_02705 [Micromonospora sp. NBC_01699]|uniref:hypothetical protein n=1 Tax=Micromonospora sp. NBC_01699 TaxID=2975984 RepID=UPI002E2DAF7D|nr:hypothetical protein [Micromonospora sp. NBC_01699]